MLKGTMTLNGDLAKAAANARLGAAQRSRLGRTCLWQWEVAGLDLLLRLIFLACWNTPNASGHAGCYLASGMGMTFQAAHGQEACFESYLRENARLFSVDIAEKVRIAGPELPKLMCFRSPSIAVQDVSGC